MTPEQLAAAVGAAVRIWSVLRPDIDLTGVDVTLAELEGAMLGVTGPGSLTIDSTAAGWGWSIAGGAMDLVAVVAHELGHAAGFDHDLGGLMASTLAPGASVDLTWRRADQLGAVGERFASGSWSAVRHRPAASVTPVEVTARWAAQPDRRDPVAAGDFCKTIDSFIAPAPSACGTNTDVVTYIGSWLGHTRNLTQSVLGGRTQSSYQLRVDSSSVATGTVDLVDPVSVISCPSTMAVPSSGAHARLGPRSYSTRLRPSRFATYIAVSARRTAASGR